MYHHTNTHAVKGIIEEGAILPIFGDVWLTEVADMEITAFLPEGRARIEVDFDAPYYLDVAEEYPWLNPMMLSLITDISKWHVSQEKIPLENIKKIEVFEDNKWRTYENE